MGKREDSERDFWTEYDKRVTEGLLYCVFSFIVYMIDIIKKIIHKEKLPVADIIFLIFILGIPIGLFIVLIVKSR